LHILQALSFSFSFREKNRLFYGEEEDMCQNLTLSLYFNPKEAHSMARSSKLESGFQDRLIQTLKALFPGCMVFKMEQIQGIPDLLILYGKHWASLECKKSAKARRQPNQDYYVRKMDEMSFSRFISPDNKEEVLHELQQAFET